MVKPFTKHLNFSSNTFYDTILLYLLRGEEMDYKSIIDNAISGISDFFESEFGYECKKGLQKEIEKY